MKRHLLCLLLALAVLSTPAAFASTLTVTNLLDDGSAGSLRQVIAGANSGDTINFAVTGTITLTSGELGIDKNLTIQGPGATLLTISGNHASRVFLIQSGVTVTLDRLTIANGTNGASGGGILNFGTVTVSNSTLSGNSAGSSGGGIVNGSDATLTVSNSTLSGNSAPVGGGINNTGTLTVSNSTLSGNSANFGGGIRNNAPATVSNSTLSGNTASGNGGGIHNGDALTVSNSTLSGNTASQGGGIYNVGVLTLSNSTLSANSAQSAGGGIFNGGIATLHNTILANSPSGGNCVNSGALTSPQGHNLDSDGTCALIGPGDLHGTSAFPLDPLLTPLQNNGGPTLTHALLAGSPALDAGDNTGAPPTDQRGFSRIFDGNGDGSAVIDIGAVEQNPADVGISLAASPSFVRTGTLLFYTITVQSFGPDIASGIVVTDMLPPGTAFVNAMPVQGSWTFTAPVVGSTGTVQGRLQGSLGAGSTVAVKLTVRAVAAGGTTITNTASVSAGTPDPNAANNVAVRSTNVFGRP